ncbi:MAG: phosphohydrolase, partial [Pedobacter sp.]
DKERVEFLQNATIDLLGIAAEEVKYFVFTDSIQNRAYNAGVGNIKILMKNNDIVDIAKASDLSNLESLQKTVEKYILCYPRGI